MAGRFDRALSVLATVAVLFGQPLVAWAASQWPVEGFGIHKLFEDVTDQFKKGVDLYQQGDLEGALTQLETARGLQPKSVWVRGYLAETYRKLRRFQDAESEWQTILLLDPGNVNHMLALAQLYLEQGKYQNAIGQYQQVLARSPGNAEALMGLAMALEGTNDLDNAADHYREVIRRHPGTQLAKSAANRLTRLDKALQAQNSNKHFPIDPDLGEAGLGWWNLKKMPLTVYIDRGEGEYGYREEMSSLVRRAMDAWSAASRGAITFQVEPPDPQGEAAWKALDRKKPVLQRLERSLADVPNDPVKSDIHVHWTDNLAAGLGLTWTSRFRDNSPALKKAHIWISTEKLADATRIPDRQTSASAAMFESQDRMLEEVIIHEFGHALGLPHSSNPNDIMCSGIYGLNALDRVERRELSPRDVQSLTEHYNNFEDTGMPARVVAQLKQEAAPPGGGAPGPAAPAGAPGADAGGATKTEAGAAGPELPPFLGEKKDEGEEKKEGEEAPEEEAPPEEAGRTEERPRPTASASAYDPIREALFDMRMKQYDKALATVNKVLAGNPRHPQAHYVKAVVYVMMRQYPQAAGEYKEVLRLVPNSQLGKLAEEGLKKIRP
ncbi:MAG TPA: tetratricopeptide repeat protein [Candidatus Obscuribacterales bacterium]